MSTSTDIYAYRILADHFEYVYRSSGRKRDASPEGIQALQLLVSRVNQAFVNAAHAVRTENERAYVIEIRDRMKALLSGQATPITDPMRFLENAVLEGDGEGALEYFQALNEKTKNVAFEHLCKSFGSIKGKLVEDGTEHLKKDPISALLLADEKSTPLYVHLKNIEEALLRETLAKHPKIAGRSDRVAIMNETLDALERGSYVSYHGVLHDLKKATKKAAKNVEIFTSGGEAAQRPGKRPTQIIVKNLDCLYAAKELYDQGLNPLVLNMANANHVGGGYRSGAKAQEEDLFRRTNLSYVLDIGHDLQKTDYYPLNKKSESVGLYVPNIVVFRAGKDHGYTFLDNPFEVAVSVIAALKDPPLRTVDDKPRLYNGDAEITFEKVCTGLEMGYKKGHRSVVLGALGCGAFHNPPDHVAEIFIEAIVKRYAYCYDVIVFAIIEDQNSRQNNTEGNFIPFSRRAIKAGGKAFNAQGKEITLQ